MNITIITQNDKFYLYEPLKFLITELRKLDVILHVVIVEAGLKKSNNQLKEKIRILQIFGLKFCIHYFIKLAWRGFRQKSVINLCNELRQTAILAQDVNDTKLVKSLKQKKTDVIISVTCNQIFKTELLNAAKIGVLNLHTSKLPQYRGVMPTFWALKNDENSIGISVFWVDEGIDTGPLAYSKEFVIAERKQSLLIQETKKIGAEMLVKVIRDICSGKIVREEQNEIKKSYFGYPTREDVKHFLKKNKFF